ncbi:hypothetical protein SAMN04487894_101303 [Niabella drilacis]|uniref:Uncharacterized protein n=1 Tax=Niabella drilacis (strain DSM 25811 / CCM 8410 / CCUG 62505 / LMG 26954 / E90) TaxID=1285928 RepID=A0A1G6IQX7_NIADE|nr:hypothetical protein SAMN04487894_101303 [Niabella drilacis]
MGRRHTAAIEASVPGIQDLFVTRGGFAALFYPTTQGGKDAK